MNDLGSAAPLRAPEVASPEVTIVILARDTPREVQVLLDGIVRHTPEPYEILVIDNGSSTDRRAAHAELAERHGARLIDLDANLTFSIANNMGIRVSSGEEVVFLNSDVEVTPNWLRNLRAALHSAPDVAAVGPRTNFSRPQQSGIWLDDSSPEGVQAFGRFFNHSDPGRWFEIDWLAGFALLARRAALEAIGGFDESLPWHGLEDKVLCEALRAAGWRILCAGDTFVHHSGHRTFEATGLNRTAARLQRPPAPDERPADQAGRLLRDELGLVFEVIDGVAHNVEAPAGLVRAGRPIEAASAGELEPLPVGSPITLCRVRGTDEVWVLQRGQRRRVLGDPERIRRLEWMSMVEAGTLDELSRGALVNVEDAVGPVPEIPARLPFNPAQIAAERLASVETVTAEIRAALDAGDGYALIRLGPDETLVLNQGMWPVDSLDRATAGVRQAPARAARALREAIIGADAVGVLEDHTRADRAPLLEKLLFHYDLYPRRRCSALVNFALMGIDPGVGPGAVAQPSVMSELLEGQRIALVCPRALAGWSLQRENRPRQRGLGFDVRMMIGLDDMREVDFVFRRLAAQRDAFDVVLAAAAVPAKPLCTRLARELDVVALDLGSALDQVVHPRFRTGDPMVTLRGEVEAYLDQARRAGPTRGHELDGKLVRAVGAGPIFYVERGAARELLGESLLELFDGQPVELERAVLDGLPRSAPVCAVHEPLSGTYALIDGRKVSLDLGLPVVAVDDLALESLPDDDRR